MIDFVVAVVLYSYTGIPGQGQNLRLAGGLVHRHHHQSITAPGIITAPVHAHHHHMHVLIRPLNA